MVDCTNCSWVNNEGVYQCINTDTNYLCHPKCYEFTNNYLTSPFYDAYNKLLNASNTLTSDDAILLNNVDNPINSIYILPNLTIDDASNIPSYITSPSDTQCTGDNLKGKIDESLSQGQFDVTGEDLRDTTFTLPSVYLDNISDFNNFIESKITGNIQSLSLSLNDDYKEYNANYKILIPDEERSNNIWPCKDDNGDDVVSDETDTYNTICNVNTSFTSRDKIIKYIRNEMCGDDTQMFKDVCESSLIGDDDAIIQTIRNTTIKYIPGIEQYLNNIPNYILEEEIQLWFEQETLKINIDEDMTDEITDIYTNILSSDEYKSFTDIFQENHRFKNCMDEILYTGDNDSNMIENFKTLKLIDYTDEHYDYITRKLDRLISIRPSDLHSCFSVINLVEKYICNGMISLTIFNVFNLIVNIFGMNIDLYSIDKTKNPEEYAKLTRLLDTIIPKIPAFTKRLVDLSKYFEKKYCNGQVTSTTLILEHAYNDIISKNIDIRYNLFDDFSFFDDFTKNIYGKIILLLLISFIISKIL